VLDAGRVAIVNDIGAWCWNELMTTDVEQAKAFFGELLGWTYETDDSGYTIKNAGHLNGGMRRQSEEQGEVAPHWLPYFTSRAATRPPATPRGWEGVRSSRPRRSRWDSAVREGKTDP
jgi:catechol 2,3-dioxygenase-like lactoylglutathione lyase family enzyme